jgi:hypothetical protein
VRCEPERGEERVDARVPLAPRQAREREARGEVERLARGQRAEQVVVLLDVARQLPHQRGGRGCAVEQHAPVDRRATRRGPVREYVQKLFRA